MVTQEHVYDLWPLAWWQHPYTIAALILIAVVMMMCIYNAWKRYKRFSERPQTPRDRLLVRLRNLQNCSYEHERSHIYCYTELMRVVREFVCAYYGAIPESLTDEEFIVALSCHAGPQLPPSFFELAELICSEACQVKFAAHLVSRDTILIRLQKLIDLIGMPRQGGLDT